jgi:hypothetical protein
MATRLGSDAPASFSAYATLARAERRSITGRWNTIAWWRRGFSPLQEIFPSVGASKPCIRRMSTLFPAPLAPRMTVLGQRRARA